MHARFSNRGKAETEIALKDWSAILKSEQKALESGLFYPSSYRAVDVIHTVSQSYIMLKMTFQTDTQTIDNVTWALGAADRIG